MDAFQIYVILSIFMCGACFYVGYDIGKKSSKISGSIKRCDDMDRRSFEFGVVVRALDYCDVHGKGNGKLIRRKLAILRKFVRKGL